VITKGRIAERAQPRAAWIVFVRCSRRRDSLLAARNSTDLLWRGPHRAERLPKPFFVGGAARLCPKLVGMFSEKRVVQSGDRLLGWSEPTISCDPHTFAAWLIIAVPLV